MIRKIQQGQSQICQEILSSLPDWFAIQSANENYAAQSEELPFFVYFKEKEACGLCMLKTHSTVHTELSLIAVKPEYHGRGLGKELLETASSFIKHNFPKTKYLSVKTLSPKKQDPYYLNTYNFYKAIGFKDFEELSDLWDKNNPCLMMIKDI